MSRTVMNTEDAVFAKEAEVFVTIDNRRYKMLMCKDFEGTAKITTKEVPKIGTLTRGHKPAFIDLAFKMTIYKCTEIFDDVIEKFLETGVMPRFQVQTSNDDPASKVGRSTKVYNDCILDGDVLLSAVNSDDSFVEQEINGYAEGITRPEKYTNPSYMT